MYDLDKNGTISKVEFGGILNSMDIRASREDIDILFIYLDLDGSGCIEYREFLKKLRRVGVKIR